MLSFFSEAIEKRSKIIETRSMQHFLIVVLRIALTLIFLGSLLGQTVILPQYISEVTVQYPEMTSLSTTYRWIVTGGITCLQVALISIWVLLSKVERVEIFTGGSRRWVDIFIAASALATVLVVILGFHLLVIVGVGGPGVLLAVASGTLGWATAGLLMLVIRGVMTSSNHARSKGLPHYG